ncbi:MAG TPA: MarR family transcriptional regulator [Acidimicrobiales bacterium]|nr:MarR family transcriptional regulator [Acidimicrobiales bacterium]
MTADPGPVDGDSGTPWLGRAQQAVWRELLAVQSRLSDRLDGELRAATGLCLADYDVLVVLAEAVEGALRMRELAARVMLSPSGLTRRVDRLVGRGLVTRRGCPSDGRGAMAALTPAGRRLLAEAAPVHVAGVRRYLLDPIGGPALDGLATGLGAIRAALDADQPGSAPLTVGRPLWAQPLVPPATESAG